MANVYEWWFLNPNHQCFRETTNWNSFISFIWGGWLAPRNSDYQTWIHLIKYGKEAGVSDGIPSWCNHLRAKRCLFWVFLFLVKLPFHRPLSIALCACSPPLSGLCLQETWPSPAFPSLVSWGVLKPLCTSQLMRLKFGGFLQFG